MRFINKHSDQAGFTIFELMIAMSILAVILLVVSAGILSFSRNYLKGITNSNTQAVARSVMSDIVQNIQFSSGDISADDSVSGAKRYCIGNAEYDFFFGQKVGAPDHVAALVKDDTAHCSATFSMPQSTSLSTSQHELLGEHMRVGALSIIGKNGVYTVNLTVLYGDDDVLEDPDSTTGLPAPGDVWSKVRCISDTGSEYCAVSHLTTTVQQRIGV